MTRRVPRARILAAALAALVCLLLPSLAQADYEQVATFGEQESPGGGGFVQFAQAQGAAVNVTGAGGVEPGSVYLTKGLERILRYSPAGELEEIWGEGVIASGPSLPNQVSALKVSATAGSYTLPIRTAEGYIHLVDGSKVVQFSARVGAFHVGDIVESTYIPVVQPAGGSAGGDGVGDITSGSSIVVSAKGEWREGMRVLGAGIPVNTVVIGVELEKQTAEGKFYKLNLSKAATETKAGVPLSGRATIVSIGPGTFEISIPANHTTNNSAATNALFDVATGYETTAPIPFNASAAELKAALVALPAFEASDLSVTGGPGDATGSNPYQLTFEGLYTGSTVGLNVNEAIFTGGDPGAAIEYKNLTSASTPGFQRCRRYLGDRCRYEESRGNKIAIDQSTGNVYVLNRYNGTSETGKSVVKVYSADGTELVASFGVYNEDIAVSGDPGLVHGVPGAIAVDSSNGKVYIAESPDKVPGGLRVMCFQPKTAGNYHEYEYCGPSQDIPLDEQVTEIALDESGHLFMAQNGATLLEERSLAEPAAPPLCTVVPKGQVTSMTVNPKTGEMFYFNGNGNSKKVYRLLPCDPTVGKFKEAQLPITMSPKPSYVGALAFNPGLSWGGNRPKGTLYVFDTSLNWLERPIDSGAFVLAPAETHPPAVLSESVSSTKSTSTVLRAEIDPRGFATHYVFQYETEAEYEANPAGDRFVGAREAPLGGGQLGSGGVGQAATAVSGLLPGTAYRFRVVASSPCDEDTGEPCVVDGEAFSFVTFPLFPPGLPDHRAYELVSPSQKNGGEVLPSEPTVASCNECKPNSFSAAPFPVLASPGGEALAYRGLPFTLLEGAIYGDSYVARRTAAGWRTTALLPGGHQPGDVKEPAIDSSLGQSLVEIQPTGGAELLLQSTAAPGSYTPLLPGPRHRTPAELRMSHAGHNSDLSHIVFAANDALTEATPYAPEPPVPGGSEMDLYDWHDGRLALVNVLPDNGTVAAGASLASANPDANAISADGSRIFWKAGGQLYMREAEMLTREVIHPGSFLAASPSGMQVLLGDGCLYSLETEACVDLTQGKGGFLGLSGSSPDLSRIYFADSGVLPGTGQNERLEEAQAEKPNLYLYEAGVGTRFIATLAPVDSNGLGLNTWGADLNNERTAEASPSGRYLAFASTVSLTGYDNVGPCGVVGKEIIDIPCREAFLYDSATARLVCASCNPSGEPPLGPATLRRFDSGVIGDLGPQPRYLTDEGRLYFDTQDPLSSRDTNEGVEDVYEYAPAGSGKEGTCTNPDGCAFLISAGTGPVDSNLIAVDESGKNVFFDTRDRLTLSDKDEQLDVYVAREGGGIPAESEVARTECQGESCQPPVSAPNDPTPGSSSFQGAGNVKQETTPKKPKRKKHKKHEHGKTKRHHAQNAKRNHGGAK